MAILNSWSLSGWVRKEWGQAYVKTEKERERERECVSHIIIAWCSTHFRKTNQISENRKTGINYQQLYSFAYFRTISTQKWENFRVWQIDVGFGRTWFQSIVFWTNRMMKDSPYTCPLFPCHLGGQIIQQTLCLRPGGYPGFSGVFEKN